MEAAIEKGLPLLFEKEMYEEVFNIGTRYLEACPRGKFIREVLKLKNSAKLKLAMKGITVTDESAVQETVATVPVTGSGDSAAASTNAAAPAAAAKQLVPAKPVAGPAAPAAK